MITAAAAIMIAVFAAFIPSPMVVLKVIGVGMAAAILIDATVVRMLLVPAVMHLLGARNWWLPAWLDRVVPEVHVEGHPQHYLPAREPERRRCRRAWSPQGPAGRAAGQLCHDEAMTVANEKRNISRVMDAVAQLWSPHVLGEVNDYDIKVANVAGEFVEHTHPDTDEVFVVLAGRLLLDLPDGTVELEPMDVLTVPAGVAHRPRADDGTRVLMVEPRGTPVRTVPAGPPASATEGQHVFDTSPPGTCVRVRTSIRRTHVGNTHTSRATGGHRGRFTRSAQRGGGRFRETPSRMPTTRPRGRRRCSAAPATSWTAPQAKALW